MKVGIHQPQYLAWPGYFAKILFSDIFILYDTAQYQKNSIINRNRILVKSNEHFLTIPVRTGSLQDMIKDKKTVDDRWKVKHLKTLEANYRKCAFFPEVLEIFKKTFEHDTDSLCDINCANIRSICGYLGIKTLLLLSSGLGLNEEGDPTQKVVDMVIKVSGTEYISGVGSKNYLKEDMFPANQIELGYFQYLPTDYPQQGEAAHVPGLSIIDMIANIPREDILSRLRKGWVRA